MSGGVWNSRCSKNNVFCCIKAYLVAMKSSHNTSQSRGISPIDILTGRKPKLPTVMPWEQRASTHIKRDTMGTNLKGEDGYLY